MSRYTLSPVVFLPLLTVCVFLSLPAGAADEAVKVEVVENQTGRIVVAYEFSDPVRREISIDGHPYVALSLGRESLKRTAGDPAVPDVSRSIIIPDDARVEARIINSSYHELDGIDVAPAKGKILRSMNPSQVAHSFGATYRTDAFYPGPLVTTGNPYIMRDHRGVVLTVNPVQYNPGQHVLRIYDSMTIEIIVVGHGEVNVLERTTPEHPLSLAFHQLYERHFINYNRDGRYAPLEETGDLMIIVHDPWARTVAEFAAHKIQRGINTTIVPVGLIGNTVAQIKNHIQQAYNTGGLAFVLLVGDAVEVAPPYEIEGAADPAYALLAGEDTYPDIMIGRFSAETPEQLTTQIERTMEYEQLSAPETEWYWRGMGIASDEGPGDDDEMDWEHVENIREDLMACSYTEVDQIYDPGASSQAVHDGLNAGRGIVIYTGHGGSTGWGSTGFSNSDINELVNDNMLPFIVTVACNNGEFDGITCFGEAWLRATNAGEPTGAIGCYASSIGQYWSPPMAAQDETIDLFVSESYHCLGTLCYAGSCLMMDEYGQDGVDMFYTWILFGDPSAAVVIPTALRVSPGIGYTASGPSGGPFSPAEFTYTLINRDPEPLDYAVEVSASWFDPSATGGTLPPLGETEITITLNGQTTALSDGRHEGLVQFINLTNHEGDTSRPVRLDVGEPEAVYVFDFDTGSGWACDGEWEFGVPAGLGGDSFGMPDPTSGATGDFVYGINLEGDYSTNIGGPYFLSMPPIDCSELTMLSLSYQRWLNTDFPPYVIATVEASVDGEEWSTLWQNAGIEIVEQGWSEQVHDLSDLADGEATLYIRWGHEVAQASAYAYSGWNLDDVRIFAYSSLSGVDELVAEDDAVPSQTLFLSPPSPNPGRSPFSFALHIAENGPLALHILDVQGRQVRALYRGTVRPGHYDFVWDGRNDCGHLVAAGTYFVLSRGVLEDKRRTVIIR
jgi:Peptidase family C25/Propeptide_C25/FlgD Ig-like domain